MTDEPEDRMTAVEDVAREAVEIARDARNTAGVAKLQAHGAFTVSNDILALLRGHGRTLEALRTTQVEQGEQIGELRAEMREMREGITKANLGINQIIGLIKDIERG
jgi:hypothetical protein